MNGIPLFEIHEVPKELRDCFEEVETQCGGPWVRVIEAEASTSQRENWVGRQERIANPNSRPGGFYDGESKTIGWRPSCTCPEQEPHPGLVLDPFAGSCRTGIEAARLGLDFIGIDLNPEYCSMGRKLLYEASPLFCGLS